MYNSSHSCFEGRIVPVLKQTSAVLLTQHARGMNGCENKTVVLANGLVTIEVQFGDYPSHANSKLVKQ